MFRSMFSIQIGIYVDWVTDPNYLSTVKLLLPIGVKIQSGIEVKLCSASWVGIYLNFPVWLLRLCADASRRDTLLGRALISVPCFSSASWPPHVQVSVSLDLRRWPTLCGPLSFFSVVPLLISLPASPVPPTRIVKYLDGNSRIQVTL